MNSGKVASGPATNRYWIRLVNKLLYVTLSFGKLCISLVGTINIFAILIMTYNNIRTHGYNNLCMICDL